MADATALPYSSTNRPSARDVWKWVARGDVGLAIGVVGIIVLRIGEPQLKTKPRPLPARWPLTS